MSVSEISNEKSNKNKGTGAGGVLTNVNGKSFESKTDNTEKLKRDGYLYVPFDGKDGTKYLSKSFEDKTITFLKQQEFIKYMKSKYDKVMFRRPDEAYVIEYKNGDKCLKVIEKKNQTVDGSVIEKCIGSSNIREEYKEALKYEEELDNEWTVKYCLCVSLFLKKKFESESKKYIIWNKIWEEQKIDVFSGEAPDYETNINKWINQ
jgi:hypothetical protein|tara:strand:+ start:345 stop:962 length:618 start_codon:yes stop_codon:yes gene_type:complete